MKLYTIALYNWRKAKKADVPLIDITVKSGDKTFSPTWDLLYRYRDGQCDEQEYVETYYQLMRKSFVQNRARWIELLESDTVAIACYCKPGKFCHRLLLKDILIVLAKHLDIEIEYLGELE